MRRFFSPLFLLSFLLSSTVFGSDPLTMGLAPYGIRFPGGGVQTTAALPSLPANMAWVAHAGGRYVSPLDAMSHLRDWCYADAIPAPTVSRCTLLIAPGVYELGDQQLIMQAGVDIVGMGIGSTVISGVVSSLNQDGTSALIRGAEQATLRGLTVVNSGDGSYSTVIFNSENSFSIEQVEVIASGRAFENYGILIASTQSHHATHITEVEVSAIQDSLANASHCFGIWHKGVGSLEISRTRVVVSDCGAVANIAIRNVLEIGNPPGEMLLVDVDARSTGPDRAAAVWNSEGKFTIMDSRLEGSYYSLGIGSFSAKIINTQLIGSVGANSLGTQCWGTYDSNLADVLC